MKADSRYIPFLDGFRGFAILFVMIGHLNVDLIKVAHLGVTLFFFVSGFLITKLLIFEHNKNSTISFKAFYLRRIFRLYPALVFFLIFTSLFILITGKKIIYQDMLAGLFYFTNYYLIYFKPLFIADHYPLVSDILWSLSVEEHFYLFFPLLFSLMFNEYNKRLIYMLYALLICFLLVRYTEFLQGDDTHKFNRTIYYTTHCRADSILYGCLAALLIYSNQTARYLKMLQSKVVFFVSLMILFSLEMVSFPVFQNVFKYSVQGICFAIIIPSFLFMNEKFLLRKILEGRVIVFIGKLSYSLYLFHWIVIEIVKYYVPVSQRGVSTNLLIIVFSLAFALVSYYGVERPFLSLRRRFGSHAK